VAHALSMIGWRRRVPEKAAGRGYWGTMAARFCSQCGAPVERSGAGFCGQCGAALRAQAATTTATIDEVVEPGYAGFWIRFLAWFLDGIVLSIIIQPIIYLSGPGFEFESTKNTAGEIQSYSYSFHGGDFAIATLIGMAIYVAYFTIAIGRWGQTIGALAVSVKVVHPDGTLLSYGAACARLFGSILSYLILWIGYLMMIWDKRKQTLHDKMVGSIVVKVKRRGEP
jgi:uncharacterized RDD family membrane protein YckC